MNPSLKLSLQLSFGEEVANSVTHAVGALLMLALLPVTAIHSFQDYNVTAVVGMSIFVISLFLMFLSSSIYHSMPYTSIPQIHPSYHRPQYDLHCYRWKLHTCCPILGRWLVGVSNCWFAVGINYF